jgi:putative peptidoglycan lipid II flippase
VLAGAVVVAGVFQVGVQIPALRRRGFRYDYRPAACREAVRRIGRNMMPTLIGLSVTQINTFNDGLMAWALARAPDGPERIPWLGGAVRYPLEQGAVAATYLAERLYEFPVGIMGLAVATAIFPLLSRHAARGDHRKLGADLTLGLRLVICLGVPAGVGLIVLAHPLVRLLLEHGQFTAEDTARTARVTAYYATGVWAYCASHVLVRGFYALGDSATPAKLAAGIVGLNLTLNLLLIWPLAEAGFAAATAISAAVQVAALTWIFARRKAHLNWPALAATTVRTLFATALMAAACCAALAVLPPASGLLGKLIHVLAPLAVGGFVFCAAYWLIGGRELGMFFRTAPRPDQWDSD